MIVLSGRPGTGKTTIAREIARRLGACYLRVDAAETALARVGVEVGVGGYAVVHELAVSNLLLGSTVVVDAVNPVAEARASWRDAADRAEARLVNVETALPDPEEHRRRVESRTADIPGHVVPSWEDVEHGEWQPWDVQRDGDRLLVDTTDTASATAQVLDALRAGASPATTSGAGAPPSCSPARKA
ncbi:AAA family ATPase [Nocardioides sp. HDW12B]|nr:AAA family ATPase [Nocardioides sp. HDW12B]